MNIKIFNIIFIVTVLLFSASFVFLKKEAIACEIAPLTSFKEIYPNVYVDNSVSLKQQNNLIQYINEATHRVTHVYGTPKSSPRIIATNKKSYSKYGFNPTGMQSSGFSRECVFLGEKGINTDVIAHELVHAEVRFRTTLFIELTQLPAWFIEGTGIRVDYREPFLLKNINVTHYDVTNIKSVFFFYNFKNTDVKSYQAARVAIEQIEPKDLYKNLARLNKGESFTSVFE